MLIWKQITDHPNYAVSNNGEVKRIKNGPSNARANHILKQGITNKGYPRVRLQVGNKSIGKYVHQLVLIAFRGNRPDGYVCNHRDGNKLNNALDNLEWVTQQANNVHALRLGLRKSKLDNDKLRNLRRRISDGVSYKKLSKEFGVSSVHVGRIARGIRCSSIT